MEPRLNIGLANFGDGGTVAGWERVMELAQVADEAGVDSLTVVDHVVLGGDLSGYPYGSFPGRPTDPWLEPLTALAAIAARTSRIRLLTGILIAPLRPATLLAKTVATLDVISGGRIDLGVGTGWLDKEYEALGLDFRRRGRLMDETLEVVTKLWRGGPTAHASPALSFDDVHCHPTPVQPGGVPIWIGGELHPRALRRIAAHASGWLPSPPSTVDDVRRGAEAIADALGAVGRDPATFRISARITLSGERPDQIDFRHGVSGVTELLSAGATDFYVQLGGLARAPAEARPVLEELVAAFRERAAEAG